MKWGTTLNKNVKRNGNGLNNIILAKIKLVDDSRIYANEPANAGNSTSSDLDVYTQLAPIQKLEEVINTEKRKENMSHT